MKPGDTASPSISTRRVGFGAGQIADRGDAAVLDPDVGTDGVRARAVIDEAADRMVSSMGMAPWSRAQRCGP